MRIKWPVAVIYIGLAIGAVVGSYAAKHRPLGPPGSLNQAMKDSRDINNQEAHPSELPYRGTAKAPVAKPPSPAPTRERRTGTRTPKPAHSRAEPHHAGVPQHITCSRIPTGVREMSQHVSRDVVIDAATRRGLNQDQITQVLRCLNK